jgi:cyclopropane-fatty-acyl-phospholipid synthase
MGYPITKLQESVSVVMARIEQQAKQIQSLLALAGIRVNGPEPWDIRVHNDRFYSRVLAQWSLGLGNSYMDGDWDCYHLDEFFHRLLRAQVDQKVQGLARIRLGLEILRNRLYNLQSRHRAFQVGEKHYNAGNDLFEAMLDPLMIYSCAYWAHADTLEQAQQDKLDMICRKLELKPGETLLDIGCGWGGLARFAAARYGVSVVGVTVSSEQKKWAGEHAKGLPVKVQLTDYRDLKGQFDKIVSVGMFEHVGSKNYREFFTVTNRLLKNGGLLLLHTIGSPVTVKKTDEWIDRHIFPNGHIPSVVEMAQGMEGIFLVEDWHNFGHDYDRTLMAWHANFEQAWPRLRPNYDERFYRMWRYYLLSSAGYFRSGDGQLWQAVLGRSFRPSAYRSIRP